MAKGYCPFVSTVLPSGSSSQVICMDKCALRVDGKCAFVVIAENLSQLNPRPTEKKQ